MLLSEMFEDWVGRAALHETNVVRFVRRDGELTRVSEEEEDETKRPSFKRRFVIKKNAGNPVSLPAQRGGKNNG
jgi:hypothetical protein